jgi:hypothetical protein
LSSYITYTGPCTFDDAKGTTTMKVEAAWRPVSIRGKPDVVRPGSEFHSWTRRNAHA